MTGTVDWLSSADAAQALGVTTRTLYRFIDEGALPGYRFGRVIRVKRTDIDTFVEQSRIQPGELGHLYPDGKSADDADVDADTGSEEP